MTARFWRLAATIRNIDFQSVRPAELNSAVTNAADKMSAGRTGRNAYVPARRCAFALALAFAGMIALPSLAVAAPDINTKTKSALFPLNNDNSARPGDTINYT